MEQQLELIRDQQKAAWNKFSPGWKKWDELTMDFLKPFGDEIIHQLHLQETDSVLDVAAGTGEPGLTIASMVKSGKVIITDLADDMLVIAHEKATIKGIRNIEFCACDVSELPFADKTFDAISCRMGFMFFPDMDLAAKELMRVLKPGGRIAASVWDVPAKNFWINAVMDPLKNNVELPQAEPGSPGLFRCAHNGMMTDLFQRHGFKNIFQKEVTTKLNCKTADIYWQFMTDTPAPVSAVLANETDNMIEKIKIEVFSALHQIYREGNVNVDGAGFVISAEKTGS
jgi:ubiquinone/menaquinone biosynthesis C-methylase UbiE